MLEERIIEVHPEVSFRELAARPLASKHTAAGLADRHRLLAAIGIALPEPAAHDVLDAAVAAWTANRYARGQALPLPAGHADRIGAIWR